MAIGTPVAGATLSVAVGATNWDVPYPSPISAGDALVLTLSTNGGVVTNPAAWAQVFKPATVTNPRGGLYLKAADGSETGTFAVTIGTAVTGTAKMWAIPGVDATTQQDAASTFVENTVSTTTAHTAPSITTVTDGAMLILVAAANSGGVAVTWTGPGTELYDQSSDSASKALAVYDFIQSPAGATGAQTATLNSGRAGWAAMMALRPAANPADNTMKPATLGLFSQLLRSDGWF